MEGEFNLLQQKIQKSVEEMISNLSKKSIYPIQKQSYLCMSNCFDLNSNTKEYLEEKHF